jgi:hypothetical protein
MNNDINSLLQELSEQETERKLSDYIEDLLYDERQLLEQEKQYEMMSRDADATYAYIEDHM